MPDLKTFLVDCESIEIAARDLYQSLSGRFAAHGRAAELFGRLAQEEENHARAFRLLQSLAAKANGGATVHGGFEKASGKAREALATATAAVQGGRSLALAQATDLALRVEASALEAHQGAYVAVEDPGFRQLLDGITEGDRSHGWLLEELQRCATSDS